MVVMVACFLLSAHDFCDALQTAEVSALSDDFEGVQTLTPVFNSADGDLGEADEVAPPMDPAKASYIKLLDKAEGHLCTDKTGIFCTLAGTLKGTFIDSPTSDFLQVLGNMHGHYCATEQAADTDQCQLLKLLAKSVPPVKIHTFAQIDKVPLVQIDENVEVDSMGHKRDGPVITDEEQTYADAVSRASQHMCEKSASSLLCHLSMGFEKHYRQAIRAGDNTQYVDFIKNTQAFYCRAGSDRPECKLFPHLLSGIPPPHSHNSGTRKILAYLKLLDNSVSWYCQSDHSSFCHLAPGLKQSFLTALHDHTPQTYLDYVSQVQSHYCSASKADEKPCRIYELLKKGLPDLVHHDLDVQGLSHLPSLFKFMPHGQQPADGTSIPGMPAGAAQNEEQIAQETVEGGKGAGAPVPGMPSDGGDQLAQNEAQIAQETAEGGKGAGTPVPSMPADGGDRLGSSAPASKNTTSPANKVAASPASNSTSSAPASKNTTSPANKVAASPASNSTSPPANKVTSSPASNSTSQPANKNVKAHPITEAAAAAQEEKEAALKGRVDESQKTGSEIANRTRAETPAEAQQEAQQEAQIAQDTAEGTSDNEATKQAAKDRLEEVARKASEKLHAIEERKKQLKEKLKSHAAKAASGPIATEYPHVVLPSRVPGEHPVNVDKALTELELHECATSRSSTVFCQMSRALNQVYVSHKESPQFYKLLSDITNHYCISRKDTHKKRCEKLEEMLAGHEPHQQPAPHQQTAPKQVAPAGHTTVAKDGEHVKYVPKQRLALAHAPA